MARQSLINKDQIIEVALTCFLKSGFEETTFQQIAKILKVSQPAIYTYFKNKMDLLATAAIRSAEKGRLFIESKVNPKEPAAIRFRQYLKANFDFFNESKKDAFSISAIYWLGQTNPTLMKIYQTMQAASHERFEVLLLQISYERGLKLRNSAHLAQLIQSCMIGELYKLVFEMRLSGPKNEKMFYDSIDTLIEANLH